MLIVVMVMMIGRFVVVSSFSVVCLWMFVLVGVDS